MGANSKPADDPLDAATVAAMLKLAGIPVADSRLPEIVLQLQRIRAIVGPVLAVPLEPGDELAPVWRP